MAENKRKPVAAPGPADVPTTFMADEGLRANLERIAKKFGIKRSTLIRTCLHENLPRMARTLEKRGWRAPRTVV